MREGSARQGDVAGPGTPQADRYRLIAENAGDVVMTTDAAGVIDWISPSVREALGWDPADLVGTMATDLVHPAQLPAAIDSVARVLGGETVTGRYRLRTSDGAYRWMSRTSKPLRDDDGEVVGRVSSYRSIEAEVRAEAAATSAESLYRLVADHAADVVVVSRDGVLEWVSPSLTRTLGWHPEEWVGHPVVEFAHPDDVALIEQRRGEIGAGQTRTTRLRVRDRDGAWHWLDAHAGPAPVEDGGVRIVSTLRLVDDLVDADRARADAEQHFRLVAEHASGAVFASALDTTFTWLSPSVRELLGWTPEQLVGLRPPDLVHPDDREEAARRAAGIAQGEAQDFRVRVRCANGDYRWIGVTARPVLDETGTVTARVGSWRDVQAEVEAEQELAALHAQYRLIAENASGAVFSANPDAVYQYVSPSVRELLGWDADEVVGRRVTDLVHPDDLDAMMQRIDDVNSGEIVDFRARYRTADGGFRWLGVTSRRVLGPAGEVAGRVGSWRSVDVEMQAERALRDEREALRATLDALLDPLVLLTAVRGDDGGITDFSFAEANPAACTGLGLSRQELLDTTVLRLFPPLRQDPLFDHALACVTTGEPLLLTDVPLPVGADGGIRRLEFSGARSGDGLALTWHDVTDRYESVRRIADSEARYRLLAENATDVVFRTDAAGIITFCSDGITPTLGWTPQHMVGRRDLDLVHPDDVLTAQSPPPGVGPDRHGPYRMRVRSARGDYRWIEVTARTLRDDSGEVVGRVGGWHDVTAEVTAERELARRARTDALTGLLNRDEVLQRLAVILAHPARTGDRLAVMFCDLDDMKSVNDTYGHAAGDLLLQRVAARVEDSVRDGDLVARIGGDEVLVVLTGVRDLDDAVTIAEKIRVAVAQPIEYPAGSRSLLTTVSIGVTVARDGENVDRVINRADRAMYEAKQSGRDRVVEVRD